ncbi:hypothetical protein PI95_017190 [Hassallia byssoidea VB512170]|uniref:Uncharacterized protein n=1 Tax=Hassallia byssoidea VB512170 TaxID=1304833 RepID=A0A846H9I5_9CYAN|nr:hypothetical protein [Hassalia byssoidea]NEU74247.1 hypothetical protein [Hassalia byssoidea VB512170]
MQNSKYLRRLMYIKYKRTHPKLEQGIYSIFELKMSQGQFPDAIAYGGQNAITDHWMETPRDCLALQYQ